MQSAIYPIQYIKCRNHAPGNGAEATADVVMLALAVGCLTGQHDGGVQFRYWNFRISIINLKTIRSDRSWLLYLVSGVAAAVCVLMVNDNADMGMVNDGCLG